MTRRIAIYGILLGSFALASCGDSPPAPSPVPERPPSASPGPLTPGPPPTPGGNINAASGEYGLTLTIGSQCTAVPEAEKIRRYTARLDDDGPGRYVVTLSDATFLTGAPPDTGKNSNPASGLYGLTLTIGPSCTILPEAERTRQYSARLADDGPGRYVVTLGDASFMEAPGCIPLRCNQFRAVEEADAMRFILDPDNEWHGGYITEKMTSGTWLTITGLLWPVGRPGGVSDSGSYVDPEPRSNASYRQQDSESCDWYPGLMKT